MVTKALILEAGNNLVKEREKFRYLVEKMVDQRNNVVI